MITHVVVFWTDKPHAENQQALIEGSKKLGEIPGVLEYRYGKPVESTRGAVDDSFSAAISMTFANQEDADAYQVHPIHKEFLETTFKPNVKRFVVYDFEV